MSEQLTRRRLMTVGAATVGVTWAAPTILTVDAAAAASGLCTQPVFNGYSQTVADGSPSGTVTRTMTVNAVPTAGTGVAHVAVGVVDHITGAAMSSYATPVGWTRLGFYDSDVMTPGTTGVGNVTNFSERLYVWYRTSGLSSTYSFDVTLSGGLGYYPQARLVVAAYLNVGRVADDTGEFAMQGNQDPVTGIPNPLTPLLNSNVYLPAISTNHPAALVVAAVGAGNVSATNTLTPPPGYTSDVTANAGAGYPPLWLLSMTHTPGPVPTTTATVTPGAPAVGSHTAVEC